MLKEKNGLKYDFDSNSNDYLILVHSQISKFSYVVSIDLKIS